MVTAAIELTRNLLQEVDEIEVSIQPDPIPEPDQYEIEIRACAANFFDLLQIRGKYQTVNHFPLATDLALVLRS